MSIDKKSKLEDCETLIQEFVSLPEIGKYIKDSIKRNELSFDARRRNSVSINLVRLGQIYAAYAYMRLVAYEIACREGRKQKENYDLLKIEHEKLNKKMIN